MKISSRAILHLREKKGLTQENMADLLKISRQTYHAWEKRDRIALTEDQVKVIEKTFNVKREVFESDPVGNGGKTESPNDVLDHPAIKALVAQSHYIMKRVTELEEENKILRNKKS